MALAIGLLIGLAALSGLADADAITLSFGSVARKAEIAPQRAAAGVLIAVAVNSAVKPLAVAAIAGARMAWPFALTIAISLIAGAGLWLLQSNIVGPVG